MNKIPTPILLCFLQLILSSGCDYRFPEPVETKKETMDAILGKWEHVDSKKSDMKNIIFTNNKNKNGDFTYVWTFIKKNSNGKMSDSGTWRYAGIGKVEIFDISDKTWVLPFYFINDHTLDLLGSDRYVKDE